MSTQWLTYLDGNFKKNILSKTLLVKFLRVLKKSFSIQKFRCFAPTKDSPHREIHTEDESEACDLIIKAAKRYKENNPLRDDLNVGVGTQSNGGKLSKYFRITDLLLVGHNTFQIDLEFPINSDDRITVLRNISKEIGLVDYAPRTYREHELSLKFRLKNLKNIKDINLDSSILKFRYAYKDYFVKEIDEMIRELRELSDELSTIGAENVIFSHCLGDNTVAPEEDYEEPECP